MRFAVLLIALVVSNPILAADQSTTPTLIAKPDAFGTLVNPECSHCRDEANRRASELRGDDRVLCWIRGYSDGGAIPFRFFLNSYRVISDSYGVFVYDPDAGYARGFAPSYDFSFYGWRNGVMVMQHKDGTLYSCLTGIAFEGPQKGSRLEPVPTLVSDWGDWLERYPGGVAYLMFDKYKPLEIAAAVNEESFQSRGPADGRLPMNSEVLGVVDGDSARAYPLETLEKARLIHESADGEPRVVFWNDRTRTAAAYRPFASPPDASSKPQPRAVTLELADSAEPAPFVDKETNSRWDIAGRAIEGELKGWTLTWLDGTQVRWFAWAAEYPESSIYQLAE